MQDKSRSKFLQSIYDEIEETEKELEVLRKLAELKKEKRKLIDDIYSPFEFSDLMFRQSMEKKNKFF